MKIEWERQEAGWYTSEHGAIVHELDGWWAYFIPKSTPIPSDSSGPFRSKKAAISAFESEISELP